MGTNLALAAKVAYSKLPRKRQTMDQTWEGAAQVEWTPNDHSAAVLPPDKLAEWSAVMWR